MAPKNQLSSALIMVSTLLSILVAKACMSLMVLENCLASAVFSSTFSSWARITEWVADYGQDGSVFNAAAPGAIQNKDLMKIARVTYGIPLGLTMPQWLLEFGAIMIGTETELILKSRWVYPGKLLEGGFKFQFPDAAEAIHELFSTRL